MKQNVPLDLLSMFLVQLSNKIICLDLTAFSIKIENN